jgi:hypothetical protein
MNQQRIYCGPLAGLIATWLMLAMVGSAHAENIFETDAKLTRVRGNTYRLTCYTLVPDYGYAENGFIANRVPDGWQCSPRSYPVLIKIKRLPGEIVPLTLDLVEHDVLIQIPPDKNYVTIFTRVAGTVRSKYRIPKP